MSYAEVKHYHGDNVIFLAEEYRTECLDKNQTQSFLGVGAQHQNARAERAIQTIISMAQTFLVHFLCIGLNRDPMISPFGSLR
jgi:hypothetical protein